MTRRSLGDNFVGEGLAELLSEIKRLYPPLPVVVKIEVAGWPENAWQEPESQGLVRSLRGQTAVLGEGRRGRSGREEQKAG